MSTVASVDAAPEQTRDETGQAQPKPAALPRVLCVDDEPEMLALLARSLRSRFDVVTSTDPVAALGLIQKESFAVVIADLHMPRMNGVSFLERVRSLAPQSTRLALTGSIESLLPADIAFGIITKPFALPVLYETISAAAQCHDLWVSSMAAQTPPGGVTAGSRAAGLEPQEGSAPGEALELGRPGERTADVPSLESGLRPRQRESERTRNGPSAAARSIPAARSDRLALALLGAVVDLGPRATLLGRAMDCDIVVNDPRVAPRHVRFFSSWRGVTVQDVSGARSVRVNGERLVGVRFIQSGDTIGFGPVDARVQLAQAPAEESS